MIQSVQRALGLVNSLTNYPEGVGLMTLAKQNGLNKSTAVGLLKTLIHMGYVSYDERTRTYRLGMAILGLAQHVDEGKHLKQLCQDETRALHDRFEEASFVCTLSGHELVVIDSVSPVGKLTIDHGNRVIDTPHRLANGQVLLAWLDEDKQRHYAQQFNLAEHTPGVPDNEEDLIVLFKQIKSERVAITNNVTNSGVGAIAVPVLGPQGQCDVAISCSVPLNRFTDEMKSSMHKSLNEASNRLSQRMYTQGSLHEIV